LKDGAIDRYLEHPDQVADAVVLEHMSMALNPRATSYKGTSEPQRGRLKLRPSVRR